MAWICQRMFCERCGPGGTDYPGGATAAGERARQPNRGGTSRHTVLPDHRPTEADLAEVEHGMLTGRDTAISLVQFDVPGRVTGGNE